MAGGLRIPKPHALHLHPLSLILVPMQPGLEIIELDTMGADYVRARVAINGRLAIPFEFLKSDYVEKFRRPEDLESFLARQAETL